jgi:multicomponent Na+:H+ antiporter subunit G
MEWIAAALIAIGALFMLLAMLGILRMPDAYTRILATSTATTLGVVGIFLGVAVHFGELGATTRALLAIVFVFLTSPVSSYRLIRAAHLTGTPAWDRTVVDELRDRRGPAPVQPKFPP